MGSTDINISITPGKLECSNSATERASEKNVKSTQGKLPKIFIYLMDNQELVDVWRYKNGKSKEYTYFSEASFSRMVMIWISERFIKFRHYQRHSDYNLEALTFKRKMDLLGGDLMR